MKLVLRSGGKIENRDPFKRSPSGFRLQSIPDAQRVWFRAKELMTFGAVAKSVTRAIRVLRTTDVD